MDNSSAPMPVSTGLTEEQVEAYLISHPEFFENVPDLLATLYLPSPYGAGTVSLAERQQQIQREKIRTLEAQMADLLQYGQKNETISDKVHRLSLGLLASQQLEILLPMLHGTLREDFEVSQVALRLWHAPKDLHHQELPEFLPISQALQQWTIAQSEPYCGPLPQYQGQTLEIEWLAEVSSVNSCALIPLRTDRVIGLLAIASDDTQRFTLDMGKLYLKRISELVSAALLRYI